MNVNSLFGHPSQGTRPRWLARNCVLAFLFASLLLCLSALPAHAAIGNRLLIQGDIRWFQLTPDGRNVIVWASTPDQPTSSIYRVPIDGTSPPKLLTGELQVRRVWGLSPDGRTVVFQGQDTDLAMPVALYSVPVRGGGPALLSISLPDETQIIAVYISPDSRLVLLWVLSVDAGAESSYYVAPLDGGEAVHLLTASFLTAPTFSPDGSHLLYLQSNGGKPEETRYTLYIMPIDGGDAVTLHETAESYSAITDFSFSPDGKSVLYMADEAVDNLWEVYRVPSTGGTPINLSRPAFLWWPAAYINYAVTPDSTSVIFRAFRTLDHPHELYSVPLTGGALVPIAPGSVSQTLTHYGAWNHTVSPDSQWIIYAAQEGNYGVTRLYRADLDNGDSLQLNKLTNGETLSNSEGQFFLSPDGSHLVFRALRDNVGPESAYSVATAGGQPVLLSDGNVTLSSWHQSLFSADSQWVFFQGSTTDTCCALFRAPAAGGAAQRMNGGLAGAFDITPLPTDGHVLFRNNDALYATYELTATTYLPTVSRLPSGAPTENLITLLAAQGNLSTFLTALDAAGLAAPLRTGGSFTIFAPTDNAFAALPTGALDQLLGNPTGQLTQILLFHILPGEVTRADITDGLQLITQQGHPVTFEVTQGQVKVNGANLITSDLRADNGVIHVIDAIIFPPTE